MINVARPDSFYLMPNDFRQSGYYILRKRNDYVLSPFLNTVFVTSNDCGEIPADIGVIKNKVLLDAIVDGDIAYISETGKLRVILSNRETHNTLLVTERCDNLCEFCSQPPRTVDDSHLYLMAGLAIAAFSESHEIGISGGEPLIDEEGFISLLDLVSCHSSKTRLHILSNGRAFHKPALAMMIAEFQAKLDFTFGIPLYSSNSAVHDELVGSKGAFNETVIGLINAGNLGIPIEVRVIPTKKNYKQLIQIVDFITRTFSSVIQISFMNLESTGWARKNWDELYLNPSEYEDILYDAVRLAQINGVPPILFNYPLCHINPKLYEYAVQSISDWKNYYPEECGGCVLKARCSGYFSSSTGRFHDLPRRHV